MRSPLTVALELIAIVAVVLSVLLAAASLVAPAPAPARHAVELGPVPAATSPVYVVGGDETSETTETTSAQPAGDDNDDGTIDEDESGWDCTTMGNRRCGPGVQPHGPVCSTDSDCAAYDRARGVISDGRP